MYQESIRKKDSNKELSQGELLQTMARYCSYQDRSQYEVEQKLNDYYLPVGVRNKILDFLVDEKFLDEDRFVKSFVRSRFKQKKWGRRKIVSHLRVRKITQSKIELGMKEIPESEYRELVHQLASKKHRELQLKSLDQLKEKARILNFLAQKGFENEYVYEAVNALYD